MTDHGYQEDHEEHFDQPHVHRCVSCGGWIIRPEIDNTICEWCLHPGRPRCHACGEARRMGATRKGV